jgi:dTMP kinase
MLKKGKLIVIDGADGSGKATQTSLLVKTLRVNGLKPKTISFPQYNQKSAGLVEEYLSGKYGEANEVSPYIASVFYACDRYDASSKLKKWLEDGNIVICDRYVTANMGHQGAKIANTNKRKKLYKWLIDLEFNLFKLPKPDLNLILHVDANTSQKLSQKRNRKEWKNKTNDIHENNLAHLKMAEKVYLEISQMSKAVLINCGIKGEMLSREAIQKKIWQEVKKIIK